MALPLYLAQTRVEMGVNSPAPNFFAYMALHFSASGSGLSNLPESLPPGAMLILDDSIPISGHNGDRIVKELSGLMERHPCESLLLDFQRPGYPALAELAAAICQALPFPVGVSELYAQGLNCPVFLSPVPPDRPLHEHLAPWTGRELWLEAALEGMELTLAENGCTAAPLPDYPGDGMMDERLHCHYDIRLDSAAHFRLWRTREDLDRLLQKAESAGVTRAIGLWQELTWNAECKMQNAE